MRPFLDAQQHRVSVSVGPRLYVRGDGTRLEQVVVNLLQNAAKYTPKGGEIAVEAERKGERVEICISDNGVGIPPEILPNVFDLFMQSDNSLDRSQGGLGIGLTLAKRLAELHGGEISVSSDGPGRGSAFRVSFPALDGELDPQVESPGITQTSPGDGVVLVVDDNRDSALLTAELLRLSGYQVVTAHDGLAALEAATHHRPKIILLDIGLPGLDGCEVAKRLRAQDEFSKTLLIAISGYGQEHDRHRSKESGFDHHLVKPVDFELLNEILHQSAEVGVEKQTGGPSHPLHA